MTSGSVEAPVLVLGLGNTLLSDDGVGPALAEELAGESARWAGCVDVVDGGTQGLALLGLLSNRRALVVLDALKLGREPGAVTVLRGPDMTSLGARRATTAHEGNAGELLAAAALVGDLPEHLVIIGVEPERIATGVGLSGPVHAALPEAAAQARAVIEELITATAG